ncbi:uncharacterized protein At5g65660 [Ricinus communis]|uniref:Uncharacterized protein n=1 Tax=Ricinus communis TaxID=3988 RepID=B9S5Z0_RICCO|nr:uncharacterized protein At5g65660 [Ricinus communis]EEF40899.1 conserved hypothetical protein [Ricinus communis]|eukprot:XP_002521409.1 uncharacterized protein At5g65660 [Ricinus communis]
MVEQYGGYNAWPPIGSPLLNLQRDENWKQEHFDNSVNAVSFGFVATAILISMFLVMAIFERFLRPASGRSHGDIESQMGLNPKLGHPSPKMTVYANGVSVLMPGDNIPTFIAHPAPVPCPPERCSHQLHIDSFFNPQDLSSTSNANSRLSSSSRQQN